MPLEFKGLKAGKDRGWITSMSANQTKTLSSTPERDVLVVIQARLGSTRLPNKVMMPLMGEPLLVRMVERVLRAELVNEVVIATTELSEDDPIEKICKEKRWPCFRGHPTDLLDRHYHAALNLTANHVAKIPSDVPLIDPSVIDQVLGVYLKQLPKYDYVSNLHPETFPYGQDVEVMSFDVLKQAYEEATQGYEREHTTPFIWSHPERYSIENVTWETGKDFSKSHRWTIDYPEDYEFISKVYDALYPENPNFGMKEILSLLDQNPEIGKINQNRVGSHWMNQHADVFRSQPKEGTVSEQT